MNMIDSRKETARLGILLFSNRKYMFALGAFLINLQKYVAYDAVIVYHDDFTAEEQMSLKKIEPRIRFVKYGMDEFVKEFGFDKGDMQHNSFVKRYTVHTAVKFKVFQYLNEFSAVILFDLDMLLLGDLDELLEKNFDIAWKNDARTIRYKLNRWGVSDGFIKQLGMYDLYNKTETPNGGFIVVKRRFDYHKAYEECVDYLRNYSFLHPYNIDEIIFGYIREKMQLNAYDVDKTIYNVWPRYVNMKSRLIHFMADYKPWNRQVVQAVFRDWKNNYDIFAARTGMSFPEVKDFGNISDCLVQADFHRKWDVLFRESGFVYPRELRLETNLKGPDIIFSYRGIASYRIETEWWIVHCCCSCWFDKNNPNIQANEFKARLRKLANKNAGFLSYQENETEFGLKTVKANLHDLPEVFYRLYELTEEFRKTHVTSYARLLTCHGTRIYVDFTTQSLTHAKYENEAETYAGLCGDRIALFISRTGMNLYIKEVDKDGKVKLTSQQTYFSCLYNLDHTISIDIKDGSLLSSDASGKMSLRHWSRDWEHFSVQTIGTIVESG